MIKYLPSAVILFLAVGVAAPACADEIVNGFYGKRTGMAATRAEPKRHDDYAGRPVAPSAVKTGREIVIDKKGRRIGLAILDFHGETNSDMLRLRSGKRLGNQIVDPTGRRVGTVIVK